MPRISAQLAYNFLSFTCVLFVQGIQKIEHILMSPLLQPLLYHDRAPQLSSFILLLLFTFVSDRVRQRLENLTFFGFLLVPLLVRRNSRKKKAAIGIVFLPEAPHRFFLLVCSRLAFAMAFIVAREICLSQAMRGLSVCHGYYLDQGWEIRRCVRHDGSLSAGNVKQ